MPVIHDTITVRFTGSMYLYTYKGKDYCWNSLVNHLVDEGYSRDHAIKIVTNILLKGDD